MADLPTISVAMATYNGERFLRDQLQSLAAQTYPPYELVACDDGSTDSTVAILEEFARRSPFPVRLYRNERHLGIGDNFLKAATLCQGELTAYCDQDDVWLPGKLRRCAELFREFQPVLAVHAAREVGADLAGPGRMVGPTRLGLADWRSNWHSAGYTIVMRGDLVTKVNPFVRPASAAHEGTMWHDDWTALVAPLFGEILHIPDCLVLHRRHGGTASGRLRAPGAAWVLASALNGTVTYGGRARVLVEIAAYLRRTGARLPAAPGARAAELAALYEREARMLERRQAIYQRGVPPAARLEALLWLVRSGSYINSAPRRAALRPRALLKDAVACLALSARGF